MKTTSMLLISLSAMFSACSAEIYVTRPTRKNAALVQRLSAELTHREVSDVNVTLPDYAVFIAPNPSKRQERARAGMCAGMRRLSLVSRTFRH